MKLFMEKFGQNGSDNVVSPAVHQAITCVIDNPSLIGPLERNVMKITVVSKGRVKGTLLNEI